MGWASFITAAAAVALLVKGLYPADLPESPTPDFVDNVFDNRGVLWAARLLLVSAAGVLAVGGIFIVVSIGIRMRNGEWLRRAGPFEVSEASVGEAEGEAEHWRRAADANREETVRLREQIARSEEFYRMVLSSAKGVRSESRGTRQGDRESESGKPRRD